MSSTKLLTYCLAPPLYELFFDISYNKDKRISPAPTELLLAQTRSYSPYDDLSCSHLVSKSWRQDPSSCSSCIRTEIAFDTYFVRAPCLNWFSLQPGLLFDWRLDWALATRPSWVHIACIRWSKLGWKGDYSRAPPLCFANQWHYSLVWIY